MVSEINKAWGWLGFNAVEVVAINDFGNILFKTDHTGFWRICPEELSCGQIAETVDHLEQLFKDPSFIKDWRMDGFCELAKSSLGNLQPGEKFCLKIPGVLGGKYEASNFGKIGLSELIVCSGDLARQINCLPDGQAVKLVVD